MGKGKGSFDHWAARVAVSQIVFEISGKLHEQVVRDAMRLAGNKLPGTSTAPFLALQLKSLTLISGLGLYELVKKGDPPVMGLTKMEAGVTLDDMKRPRVKLPGNAKAGRGSASTPVLPAADPTAAVSL